MSVIDEFKDVTGKKLPCPKNMSTDEKAVLVCRLKMAGESMTKIAEYLGVSRKYAYDLKKKAENELRDELECRTYLDNFVSILHELTETRDIHRKRVNDILSLINNGGVDPVTGEKIGRVGSNRDLSEAARLVKDYDKLIIDLQKSVGVIPTVDVNPYNSIKDKSPTEIDGSTPLVEKNSEELMQILLDKLQSKQSSLTPLKNMKDEPVI